MVNKTFKENLGPKLLLCTEKGKLNKLKFKIIFVNIYSKFNVIFYTNKLFRVVLKNYKGNNTKIYNCYT